MSKLLIEGGVPLNGAARIHGAKNAVLPILAATVLLKGESVIHDCPQLKDVNSSIEILKHLGARIKREGSTLIIDTNDIDNCHIPEQLMREMRSSIMFLGGVLGRCGTAKLSLPGGCELGPRPINMHLKSLRRMNVHIEEAHGYINCETDRIRGGRIHLDFPSVGATENIMLAACLADGETIITNAAKEPEISDLALFLNKMGAKIYGAGSGMIKITGVSKLHSAEHTVMPDRIVFATYLTAAAITGGNILIRNAKPENSEAFISVLRDCGCIIDASGAGVRISAPERLNNIDILRTMPYPGFPTDAQPVMMALLSVANGTSMIVETIFENRFRQAQELTRMDADIQIADRVAVIKGIKQLTGARVTAMDLRAGAALVVAGLNARGITEILDIDHIDRGYESIETGLAALGAKIIRTEETLPKDGN